jgi:PAS domain S-box-containing protein
VTDSASASEAATVVPDCIASNRDAMVGPDQLLALLDNTTAVIYMRNVDGRYMLVNAEYERLFGIRREDILGRTDHEIFPAHIADEFRANDIQAIAGRGPIQVEETAPADDGIHTYVTVKFPLLDLAGEPYAICGISTDITARKKAEDEVAVLNAELERRVLERTAELETTTSDLRAFAYSVSHDLRAPLRSLHGFSEVLLDEYPGRVLDEAGVAYLRRVQANATQMEQTIEALLTLSRTVRAELRREQIDLGELATVIQQELQAQQPDREVDLRLEGELIASADERLFRLALQNLMTNAWKFTAKRSRAEITIGSLRTESRTVFFIRDNGAGFDPRLAQKLFEPFQRLHSTRDFEGTGIGLAIVQRVIGRHSGEIWAESTPDHGATFFFTTVADSEAAEDQNADPDHSSR